MCEVLIGVSVLPAVDLEFNTGLILISYVIQ